MTTEKPSPKPVPTVAALYGAAVDIRRIVTSMNHERPLLYASICIAADEAAHAMLGTKNKEPAWGFGLDRESPTPTPEHAAARAGMRPASPRGATRARAAASRRIPEGVGADDGRPHRRTRALDPVLNTGPAAGV